MLVVTVVSLLSGQIQPVPFLERFEGPTATGWTGGSLSTGLSDSQYYETSFPFEIVSPQIGPVPVGATLKFSFIYVDGLNGPTYGGRTVPVRVNGNQIYTISQATHGEQVGWHTVTLSLLAFEGEANIRISWQGIGATGMTQFGLDDVEVIVHETQHDLVAQTGLRGPAFFSAGTNAQHSFTVFNAGALPASNYTVRLMRVEGVHGNELSTLPGVEIAPQQSHAFTFTWTFPSGANTRIYAEIVYADDQNPGNNRTPNFDVLVLGEGLVEANIGGAEGVFSNEDAMTTPFAVVGFMNFRDSWSVSQTIYLENEIEHRGAISHIVYRLQASRTVSDVPIRVYMTTTDMEQFPDNQTVIQDSWLSLEHFNEPVFDDFIQIASGTNDVLIPLTRPFNYDGGNLLVMVHRFSNPEHSNTMLGNFSFRWQVFGDASPRAVGRAHQHPIDLDNIIFNPDWPAFPIFLRYQKIPTTRFIFNTSDLGSVSGTVTYQEDPVSGVRVEVVGTNRFMTTGIDGKYSFDQLFDDPPVRLIARRELFTTYLSPPITVLSGEDTPYDIKLELSESLPPTNIFAATQQNAVHLTWSKPNADGVVGYNVFRTTEANRDSSIDTWTHLNPASIISIESFADITWPTLNHGVYYYGIIAVYATYVGIDWSSHALSSPVIRFELKAPSNIHAEKNEEGDAVTLSWTKPDVDIVILGYHIYRSSESEKNNESEWTTINLNHAETTITDEDWEGLEDDTYIYFVRVVYAVYGGLGTSVAAPSNSISKNEMNISDATTLTITALNANYPNPFNPSTIISFDIAKAGNVSIEIFNIRGQRVRTLANKQYEIGSHQIEWNGTDDHGRGVGSGVYLYVLRTGEFRASRTMLMMK
jgi:hypothetical protein